MKLKLGIIGEEHTAAIIEEVLLDYKEFDSSIFLDPTGSAGTFLLLPSEHLLITSRRQAGYFFELP